jgi:hypothetical protein
MKGLRWNLQLCTAVAAISLIAGCYDSRPIPTLGGSATAMTAAVASFRGIRIEAESDARYRRSLYKHWIKVSGECYDVRNAVLAEESVVAVEWAEVSASECRVAAGEWHDPYTGETFVDPSDLDIDHMVPLKEVHQSGGHAWSADRRRAYANSMEYANHLIAVDSSANRSKGDRDPAEWLPENDLFLCDYLRAWLDVKEEWNLSADEEEVAAIGSHSAQCAF